MIEQLTKTIYDGKLKPNDVIDAQVWMDGNRLSINTNGNISLKENCDAALFLWLYDKEEALDVRKIEPENGCITVNFDDTVLFQMKHLNQQSARIAVAWETPDGNKSCFIRNKVAKAEGTDSSYRQIGPLIIDENDRSVFCAFWTEGGLLSARFRQLELFEKDMFCAHLAGYEFIDRIFAAYIDLPMICGDIKVNIVSLTSGEKIKNSGISLTEKTDNGLRRICKVEWDLKNFCFDKNDAYKFIVRINEEDCTVVCKNDLIKPEIIHIDINDVSFEVTPVCESDNSFSLQICDRIYDCMVSVITAVYNTQYYLAEMINSVLEQDTQKLEKFIIGNDSDDYGRRCFLKCFEFILVDDGSTDGSSRILDEYAGFDDRIKVFHKANGGVSSARNLAIGRSSGKYTLYVDSDDVLLNNHMAESTEFFENNPEIVMTTVPVHFFEAYTGEHWTNNKFSKKREVVDLIENPRAVTVFVSGSTFRTDKSILFDENIEIGEDLYYIYGSIFRKGTKLGLIGTTKYMYRKRIAGEQSAIQLSRTKPGTYLFFLENILEKTILDNLNENGMPPLYVQYNVMGQLQWRFSPNDKGEQAKKVLGEDGFAAFKKKAIELLKYVEDDVILYQKKIWDENKYYMLAQKYGKQAEIVREGDDAFYFFGNTGIGTSIGRSYIAFEFMEIEDEVLKLEGYGMDFCSDVGLAIYVNGEKCEYTTVDRDINKYSMDDICFFAKTFLITVKLDRDIEEYRISFFGEIEEKEIKVQKRDLRCKKNMPITQTYKKSYYKKDGWASRIEDREIVIRRTVGLSAGINYEREFENEILNSKGGNELSEMIELRQMAIGYLAYNDNKRKIWLISDRVNVAGDNGEALFRFVTEKKDPDVDAYFVIDGNSDDFERMKKIGKTVARNSQQHYLLQLVADYVISSAGDEFVINPWYRDKKKTDTICDLLARKKFVFLQHGIIKDDLSEWLNRYSKNMAGFVCTAEREAQSILDCEYFYKPENVWLTGLPRHDRLYDNEKRKIVIMPTWRRSLMRMAGPENMLVKGYENSAYYRFYNALITDEKLLSEAAKYDYQICFMPHPSIKLHGLHGFKHDKRVEFFDFDVEYKDVFAEASLVMTDYSSSAMEFALLHKPVVYCQFDKDEFFDGHVYVPGYFDYEKDGFGEVTYDLESLINLIIEYMKNGCKVHEPYSERMDRFFKFHDKNNCQRVYEKIKGLDR
ncbi:MAG: bifunctional glycosyltransferase family 2 protein/CDP-glycerol:glycerophosphate glycerophosphotransferase [Lachnospiraceae bacterium]|nr:bifunctional glycosyltransferase family 2 protein/CDP-glycerol:glycerophosphate glycerophosphotransferase [Lachnospiraceae bacterium]